MYTTEQLEDAYDSALCVINYKGGFDTFKFRRGGFEDDPSPASDKQQVLAYLKTKMPQTGILFAKVKKQIDTEEFSSDYYTNPDPRKFRGAYAPVVLKTVAGIMLVSL